MINNKKINKLKVVVLTLFFVVMGSLAYGMWYVNDLIGRVEAVEIDKNAVVALDVEDIEVPNVGDIRNIALFGIDSQSGEKGRSDSIMILTLDSIHNKLKLTSIMRDSYVNIPGYYMDKINHAYAFGGPELSIKTLNKTFGLNITEFISVNFESIEKIIDKLGGVDISLTNEEVSYVDGIKSAGIHTLNGKQALQFSRIRYATGGDAKRTERHRIIINSLFEKVKTMSLTQYPDLLKEILPFIQTNMTMSEILGLATEFPSLISNGMELERFPRDEDMIDRNIKGIYYLDFDKEVVKQQIQDYIFEDKK